MTTTPSTAPTTGPASKAEREDCIGRVRALPAQLEALVGGLSEQQLTTAFVPGEWTVAQNVHHLADTHAQNLVRLKLILVEDRPAFTPFQQNAWAVLPDGTSGEVAPSLTVLRGLHARLALAFAALDEGQRQRVGLHPVRGEMTADTLLAVVAWHGEAHLRQIRETLAAS